MFLIIITLVSFPHTSLKNLVTVNILIIEIGAIHVIEEVTEDTSPSLMITIGKDRTMVIGIEIVKDVSVVNVIHLIEEVGEKSDIYHEYIIKSCNCSNKLLRFPNEISIVNSDGSNVSFMSH